MRCGRPHVAGCFRCESERGLDNGLPAREDGDDWWPLVLTVACSYYKSHRCFPLSECALCETSSDNMLANVSSGSASLKSFCVTPGGMSQSLLCNPDSHSVSRSSRRCDGWIAESSCFHVTSCLFIYLFASTASLMAPLLLRTLAIEARLDETIKLRQRIWAQSPQLSV